MSPAALRELSAPPRSGQLQPSRVLAIGSSWLQGSRPMEVPVCLGSPWYRGGKYPTHADVGGDVPGAWCVVGFASWLVPAELLELTDRYHFSCRGPGILQSTPRPLGVVSGALQTSPGKLLGMVPWGKMLPCTDHCIGSRVWHAGFLEGAGEVLGKEKSMDPDPFQKHKYGVFWPVAERSCLEPCIQHEPTFPPAVACVQAAACTRLHPLLCCTRWVVPRGARGRS